jgi:pimeloyl-ACP methyl ester carboxylesterase
VTSIQRNEVRLAGGVLSMLAAGPEGGEPVVLMHGLPSGAELWRDVIGELGALGFRCYAPDLPGYGNTRLPDAADRSIYGAADLITALIDEANLGPVWLVGHDLGGMVAQTIAVRRPDQIERLTLSDCPVEATWPVTPVRLFRALARLRLYAISAALGLVPNPYANLQIRRGFFDPARLSADDRARVFWDSKTSDPRGRTEFQSHLAALDNRQSVAIAQQLGEFRKPTLVVWASHDRFQPWGTVGVRLRALLPHADADIVVRAGHFVVLEKPEEYLEILLRWRRGELHT